MRRRPSRAGRARWSRSRGVQAPRATARQPMSRRKKAPAKCTLPASALERCCAPASVLSVVVAASTRPPLVTWAPSAHGGAGVEDPAAVGRVRQRDRNRLTAACQGSRPRRSRSSRRLVRGANTGTGSIRSPRATCSITSKRRASFARAGSTACVSGSPKRQLNSTTRGPVGVSNQPHVQQPAERHPAHAHLAERRRHDHVEHVLDAGGQRVAVPGERRVAGVGGAVRTHAAGVRARVALTHALVILWRQAAERPSRHR